ncbi:hypothetical protein [Rhodopirellula sallentina]|uniref:Sulfatase n=1 Tax=Rhodopirellula sallentina SM41 TaxID=1263870 RepID=M5TZ56_9BACT|nr:hypothetical protein [Rhodopirellula sallentina]EMI54485.1 hypothetical protein RSSM_04080 [Rhodopirellula sallentina SM41]
MFVFTLEGFSPAALSCYGASWNRTETIDAMAAHGTAWDRVVTPVVDPTEQIDRWLTSKQFPADNMTVVTDDERIAELPAADRIGDLIVIPPRTRNLAETLEETNLASLAAIASEQLPDNPHVWLHSRFLTRCWDAPRELFPIDQLDEADLEPMDPSESIEHELNATGDVRSTVPPILDDTEPPRRIIHPDDDPDWVMAWMRTYGCQIRLIDAVAHLMNSIAESSGHSAAILAGSSGFALGQNGAIGHRSGPLRSCHLHVPLLSIGFPKGDTQKPSGIGIRDRRVSSADILPDVMNMLSDNASTPPISPQIWAGGASEPSQTTDITPQVVTQLGESNVAITTENWFYVRENANAEILSNSEDDSATDPQSYDSPLGVHDGMGNLFLKPDDLNDTNDVARLRHDVTEELEETLAS